MDPVTFQVIQGRLSGIVQEMQNSIFRTGYSTIIRESQDASCMLMDAAGEVVGEHVILPLHATALPEVVRAIRRAFEGEIASGDAFITNHPYESGVTHSMDLAVVTPVFIRERLVAFCGSIAHKSDLGGAVPGTGYGSARELFQEGIQYPVVRYLNGGTVVRDVEAILRANSRTPELVLGDLRGQVGVARLGEQRLAQVAERYGLDTLLNAFAQQHDVTEQRIRAALVRWPDGSFTAEAFNDHDGIALDRPIRYHVRITKTGDRILFDFSESDDQRDGPVNVRPPLVRGCCHYALIAMIDAHLPNNGGLARVVETRFRPGSVLNPMFPAPCNTYMGSSFAVTEAALQALGGFVPQRRIAGGGGEGAQSITGRQSNGKVFVQYELIEPGCGAVSGFDGLSASSALISNSRAASIEILESEFPTRLKRFELIPDSGGAGCFRGGLAQRRVYEILADEAHLTLRGGRHVVPAFGLDGGLPGQLGSCVVNPGTPSARAYPSRYPSILLHRGDVVDAKRAGGGGLGDPLQRSFDDVLNDVIDGYVTRHAAITLYGVDATRLDAALTEASGIAKLDLALEPKQSDLKATLPPSRR